MPHGMITYTNYALDYGLFELFPKQDCLFILVKAYFLSDKRSLFQTIL